jgi:hypothetical protein
MRGSICNYDTFMAGMQICYDMLQQCIDACSGCPPPPGKCF